ncbi:MAG: hypothetical protein AAF620_19595 [Bacteroidota bacterium]
MKLLLIILITTVTIKSYGQVMHSDSSTFVFLKGKIGNTPASLLLNLGVYRFNSSKSINATYYYEKYKTPIKLFGSKQNDSLFLKSKSGELFKGKIKDHSFTGIWSLKDRELQFKLNQKNLEPITMVYLELPFNLFRENFEHVASGNSIFFSIGHGHNGSIANVSFPDATVNWKKKLPGYNLKMLLHDNYLLIISENKILALNKSDGTEKWSLKTPIRRIHDYETYKNQLLLLSEDEQVYQIDLELRKVKSTVTIPHILSSWNSISLITDEKRKVINPVETQNFIGGDLFQGYGNHISLRETIGFQFKDKYQGFSTVVDENLNIIYHTKNDRDNSVKVINDDILIFGNSVELIKANDTNVKIWNIPAFDVSNVFRHKNRILIESRYNFLLVDINSGELIQQYQQFKSVNGRITPIELNPALVLDDYIAIPIVQNSKSSIVLIDKVE